MSLKSLREAQGMSQSGLASIAGVSVSTITKIEQGITDIKNVPAITVSELAGALHVPERLLVFGEADGFEYEEGRLVVDELALKPDARPRVFVRIHDKWYICTTSGPQNLTPYEQVPPANWRRSDFEIDYLMAGIRPRKGFHIVLGRAATADELASLTARYGQPSAPQEKRYGSIYGKSATVTATTVTYQMDNQEALRVEHELQDQGICADNASAGSLTVRIA